MTVKTLTYIHSMLKDEEEKYRRLKEAYRDTLHEAEDSGVDSAQAKAMYEHAKKAWSDAYSALNEFETREW